MKMFKSGEIFCKVNPRKEKEKSLGKKGGAAG